MQQYEKFITVDTKQYFVFFKYTKTLYVKLYLKHFYGEISTDELLIAHLIRKFHLRRILTGSKHDGVAFRLVVAFVVAVAAAVVAVAVVVVEDVAVVVTFRIDQ